MQRMIFKRLEIAKGLGLKMNSNKIGIMDIEAMGEEILLRMDA